MPTKAKTRKRPRKKTPRYFKGRGPEAMANAQAFMALVRGRPRKGARAVGTSGRTLRLPDDAWAELERCAGELGLPLHGLLRQIVGEFLYTQATVPPRTSRVAKASKASKRSSRGR